MFLDPIKSEQRVTKIIWRAAVWPCLVSYSDCVKIELWNYIADSLTIFSKVAFFNSYKYEMSYFYSKPTGRPFVIAMILLQSSCSFVSLQHSLAKHSFVCYTLLLHL
jgi:hypothetical protein